MQQLNAHNNTKSGRERVRKKERERSKKLLIAVGKSFPRNWRKFRLGNEGRTNEEEKTSLPCSLATFTFSPLAKVKEQRDVYAIFEAQTKGIYTHTHSRI